MSEHSSRLLLGTASLAGVPLTRLGLEIPEGRLSQGASTDTDRLARLRRAGLDVMLRVAMPDSGAKKSWPVHSSQLALDPAYLTDVLTRARALRLSVAAGNVSDRSRVLELGEAGVAAIHGQIAGNPVELEGIQRFLGPCEEWLEQMRVDSI